MIPVTLQPPPANFATLVQQPGLAWLAQQGISPNAPPPKASDLPNFWTRTNKQLWDAYSGVCAYLATYFEWGIGASSTDHFVAKSKNAGEAYNWDNYRLSCLGANRNKNKFDDVLDPIGLEPDSFLLNLTSGKIRPNPVHSAQHRWSVRRTIRRIDLNSPEHCAMRARRFRDYLRNQDAIALEFYSPFVFHEAQRQGMIE